MVLGKPGAGKTAFLKHLVLQATNGKINKIPIFVSLKAWSDSDHLLNHAGLLAFIAEQFDICDFPSSEKFVEIIVKEGHAS
jgi:predicted NACHT family NTPase